MMRCRNYRRVSTSREPYRVSVVSGLGKFLAQGSPQQYVGAHRFLDHLATQEGGGVDGDFKRELRIFSQA